MTASPGSSCFCSAVAISGTAPTAGCSTRTAGTICRTLGGTTAVAHKGQPLSVTTTLRFRGYARGQASAMPKIESSTRPVGHMAERRQHSPYSFYENILQTQSHHRTRVRARKHRKVPQRQTLPQGRERIPQPPSRLGFAFTADRRRDRTRRIQVRAHPLLPPYGTDFRQDTHHRTRKHPPSDLRLRLRYGVDATVPREGRQMADGEHPRQGHSRRTTRDQTRSA